MYKLILVDDEAEIRQGLKEIIPFESLGFTVVGEAGDGVEALHLCETTEPDLMITDIRMPMMDGLTLCRRARAVLPMLQCIILSGYDDFNFAQQAIELKTMSYMLKPISSGEFRELLEKARVTLDEEFSRRKNLDLLRAHFRESLPLLRKSLLASLLNGDEQPEAAMERAEKYRMHLNAGRYMLALFRACENVGTDGIEDEDLRSFAVQDILCEVFQAHALRTEVFPYRGQIAVLFMFSDASDAYYAQLVELTDEARKTVRHYLGCALYAGMSAPCDQLSLLPNAVKEATSALYQCVLNKIEQVLCITDIRQRENDVLMVNERLLSTLSNSLKARDAAGARAALDELMTAAGKAPISPIAWQAYQMEIMMCFFRVISEQGLVWEGLDAQLDGVMQRILHDCPGVNDAALAFHAITEPLLNAMEAHRQSSSRLLSAEAEHYLQDNYQREDTSLEQLCLHLHISPSYFSMIFKKETKKTFHQYLTDLRMTKALTLLSTTDMKIAQVAESVGLPDHSYFSYCFRRHFGYPPSRARGH